MSFRGVPDPLHGDTFNALVRKNAKDLMEIIFNTPQDDAAPRAAPGTFQSSIARDGFGGGGSSSSSSSSGVSGGSRGGGGGDGGYGYNQGGGSVGGDGRGLMATGNYNSGVTGASGKKMWGYGNTPMPSDKPSLMNKMKAKFNEYGEKMSDKVNELSGGDKVDRRNAQMQAMDARQAEMEASFRANSQGGYTATVQSDPPALGQQAYKSPDPAPSAFAFKNTAAASSAAASSGSFSQPAVTKDTGYERRL
eukprot:UC1_evm1s778